MVKKLKIVFLVHKVWLSVVDNPPPPPHSRVKQEVVGAWGSNHITLNLTTKDK